MFGVVDDQARSGHAIDELARESGGAQAEERLQDPGALAAAELRRVAIRVEAGEAREIALARQEEGDVHRRGIAGPSTRHHQPLRYSPSGWVIATG